MRRYASTAAALSLDSMFFLTLVPLHMTCNVLLCVRVVVIRLAVTHAHGVHAAVAARPKSANVRHAARRRSTIAANVSHGVCVLVFRLHFFDCASFSFFIFFARVGELVFLFPIVSCFEYMRNFKCTLPISIPFCLVLLVFFISVLLSSSFLYSFSTFSFTRTQSAAVPVPGMLLAAPTSLDAVSSSTASASSVIAVAPAAPQQHVQHQSRTSQAAQGFNHPHFHAQQQHQHQQQQHLQAQMQFQMSMQRGRNFGQPQQFAPSGPMMMGVPPNFPFPYGGPMILPNLVSQPMPMSLMSGPVYLGAPPPSALGVANLSGALPSQVLNPISALPPAAGATSTSTLLTSAGYAFFFSFLFFSLSLT